MALKRSPLAPARLPDMPAIGGVRMASANAGVKYKDRDDVTLFELAPGAAVAGVLTRSKTAGAPVEWCRKAIAGGRGRALLVNAGNANAFTGAAGLAAVERTVEATRTLFACRGREVYVASTGVIGEPLPDARVTACLKGLQKSLKDDAWHAAAKAIMTTDTFPKAATRICEIDGVPVTINGIAKGSGMIAPDMATMLSFVFTDAKVPAALLQSALKRANDRSFNAITVDGDTSTSDTLLLFATGTAKHRRVTRNDALRLRDFQKALNAVCLDLAQQVVRDGEGASKFVTVTVSGAASASAARKIALAIGNSPLVKTAIAGEDANWGRIVMAVGKAGERADRDRLSVTIGGCPVAREGEAVPGYDEAPVARHMKSQEIDIEVDVGVGRGRATIWTCDLTHGYIDINADYRS